MSNARSARRRLQRESRYGSVKEYPSGTTRREYLTCQHCGATDLDLMESHAELVQVAGLHGMRIGPIDPTLGQVRGFWFCHRCAEGGAVCFR